MCETGYLGSLCTGGNLKSLRPFNDRDRSMTGLRETAHWDDPTVESWRCIGSGLRLETDPLFEPNSGTVMRISVACAVLAMICLNSVTHADNWGHWRGPNGNGTANQATPPTEWSSSKNVKWKVEIPGRGSSSPVIWGNQVFVTTAVPAKGSRGNGAPLEFKLLCFDRTSGKEVLQRWLTTKFLSHGITRESRQSLRSTN